jgi:16S rRNA (uracil1498-N3)-methyltransferase
MTGTDPIGAGLHRRRSHPLVFVADLESPELDEDDHRHLSRSLRVRADDTITICDAEGRWRSARFGRRPVPESDIVVEPVARRWGVGFALVKGDRPELVVQKLTELGADLIVPMVTERTVVRWTEDKIDKHHRRHERVAREAAMQSRRVRLPRVERTRPLNEVLHRFPGTVLADPAGRSWLMAGGDGYGPMPLVVVGPEGGFSDEERSDRPIVRLPGGILRTETAAIAAGVLLAVESVIGDSPTSDPQAAH